MELDLRVSPTLRPWPYNIFLDYIEKWGGDEYYNADFARAIKFMESIATSYPKNKDNSSQPRIKITAQDILTSTILIKKITPWAKEIRKKLFGSPKPPFNWEGAVGWIQTGAKKKYHDKYYQEFQKLTDKWETLSNEFTKYHKQLILKQPILPYVKKGDPWIRREAVNGPKMAHLEQESKGVAKATGFSQQALVMFILAGIKPLALRMNISTNENYHQLSDEELLYQKEVVLRIRARDFASRELSDIYRELKKELTIKKEIKIKDKHVRIHELVQKLGPPPNREKPGSYKYWKKAIAEWERKYPKDQPKMWHNLRDAWERMEAKFDL